MSELEAVAGADLAAFGVLEAGFAAGSAGAGVFAVAGCAAGSAAAGALAGVASATFAFPAFFFVAVVPADVLEVLAASPAGAASPALAFLLFFLLAAVVSAGAAESLALSFPAAAFLLFDFFFFAAEASVLAVLSPAAAVFPAAAFSFFYFFLDFLVVVSVLVGSLGVDCALTTNGATAATNIKQKNTVHKVSLFLE